MWDNCCPSAAGHTIPDTSQDAVGLLGHLGTQLAPVQLAVHQQPRCSPTGQLSTHCSPTPVALHGVILTQAQDPALSLVEPHTVRLGLSIEPVQNPQ